LVVKSTPLEEVSAGQAALWKFQVFNEGNRSVDDVTVSASVKGAKIVTQATSRGSCNIGTGVSCELGTLAPGEGAEVHVGVEALDSVTKVTLSAVTPDAKPCESDIKNNSLEVSVAVTAGAKSSVDLSPSGGCGGCALPSEPRRSTPLWLALGALALLRLRRRTLSKGSWEIR
jgi:MYXO-CTERM domain-containing protein